jgi:hypothetical protein
LVNDLNTPQEKVGLTIPQPIATEIYYSAAEKIDKHNRDPQPKLAMETKLKTHDWSMCGNMQILFMCVVYTWRFWTKLSQEERGNQRVSQKTIYGHLAMELINNTYETVTGNTRHKQQHEEDEHDYITAYIDPLTGLSSSGEGINLRKCNSTRSNPNCVAQEQCRVCQNKPRLLCIKCSKDTAIQCLP